MTSGIEEALKDEFEKHPEIHGTEEITINLIGTSNRNWVIALLRRLASGGHITIIRSSGGRGKKTIYKRNRNSPGQPRKL